MKIKCIWEHNGDDTLLYAEEFVGAFTRGESVEIALQKMKSEIYSYSAWLGEKVQEDIVPVVVQEKNSDLEIKDADSDVFFFIRRRVSYYGGVCKTTGFGSKISNRFFEVV